MLANIDAIITRRNNTTPASVRVFMVEPCFRSHAVNTAMAAAISHRAIKSIRLVFARQLISRFNQLYGSNLESVL